MKAPLIGITGYHVRGEEGYGGTFRGVAGQGFAVFGHDYIEAVRKAGGIPIGIPVADPSHTRAVLKAVDGLILSGGEDIDPTLYGEHPDARFWVISPERDRFELKLLEAALALGKPVLAICRGLQLVNVFFGGTLYKDNSDRPGKTLMHQFNKAPRWYLAHRVKLLSPLLQELYGAEEIETNSYHHQSVFQIGRGLQVSAVAEDGVIEGLAHPDYPNLLAIQWHPEMMAVQNEQGLIPFKWLIGTIQKQLCTSGEGGG